MRTLIKKAYAKINIGLEILNKRMDLYHNINTVYSRICLHDTITISDHETFVFESDDHLDIEPTLNLVHKAAMMFRNTFNIRDFDIKISLNKSIPSGAGLGGGSTDAASTLLGLAEFYDIEVQDEHLFRMALKLGMDVPYFLYEGSAVASGRGEQLEYFDYKVPYHILVVYPAIHIPTPWAYKNLLNYRMNSQASDLKSILLDSVDDGSILKEMVLNDFEETVHTKFPVLRNLKDQLYSLGAIFALMSGSGSAIYAFFESRDEFIDAYDHFSQIHSFQVFSCSGNSSNE
ncbi:MAG: 4-(cytidine 5'-diphospho)-2-C-methyl-D-erythritol kinase [Candidatus Kapabacteria bacterium]|nr:4-(cytidine 5'-diphospho)-2-C-methyl-D-erythritol kinase [Candidatus Kapabacteria bacterium]